MKSWNTIDKIFAASVLLAAAVFGLLSSARAFQGPGSGPGVGTGAIGVNGANNLSVGTTTPTADTKFLVVASSTNSTEFSLKVLQPAQSPIFVVRNDGNIGVATSTPNAAVLTVQGNIYVSGQLLGASISANNVSQGLFGNGSGNFSFPLSLGINTSTNVNLPQPLSVYGSGYFSNFITSPGAGVSSERFGLNSVAAGSQAVAFGNNARANTTQSVAIGTNANAITGGGVHGQVVIGFNAIGSLDSVVIGPTAQASSTGASQMIAIGDGAIVNVDSGIAIGGAAVSAGTTTGGGIAIGQGSTQTGFAGIAIGAGATALGSPSSDGPDIVIGASSVGGSTGQVLVGYNITTGANAIGATVIGDWAGASAGASSSVVLGYYSEASQPSAIAIGPYTSASATNAIVIGAGNNFNQLLTNTTANSLLIGQGTATTTIFANFANNRVGIATTTPSQALAVQGNLYVSGNVTCGGSCGGGGVNGSGTADTIAIWAAGGTTLGNSNLKQNNGAVYDTASGISVGTSTTAGVNNVLAMGQFLTGTITANQVTAGLFGNGSGNFVFPLSLGVNTSSQVGLSSVLTVYGNMEAFNMYASDTIVFIGSGAGNHLYAGSSVAANNDNIALGANALSGIGTNKVHNIAIGVNALSSSTGNYDIAIGGNAIGLNNFGFNNVAIGWNAQGHMSTGAGNIAIGTGVIQGMQTGSFNVAIGHQAGQNLDGSENVLIGHGALDATSSFTEDLNVIIGSQAASNATSSRGNVMIGYSAGFNNISSTGNIFLGTGAGYYETGSQKLYIHDSSATIPLIYGDFATTRVGIATTTPSQALAVQGNLYVSGNVTCGGSCGGGSVTGSGTSGTIPVWTTGGTVLTDSPLQKDGVSVRLPSGGLAIGTSTFQSAGNLYITGQYLGGTIAASQVQQGVFGGGSGNYAFPVSLGVNTSSQVSLPQALSVYGNALVTGGLIDMQGSNAYIGTTAGGITGGQNVGVGYQALQAGSATGSTAVGWQALKNNSGNNNTAVGWSSMNAVVTGIDNAALGYNSLGSITSGNNNVGVGYGAGVALTTGANNVGVGFNALQALIGGTQNVAIGSQSLTKASTTATTQNIAIGYQSMQNAVSGVNLDVAIGPGALQSDAGFDNIAIGSVAMANSANGGSDNVAIGSGALQNNNGGSTNVAIGKLSMNSNSGLDNNAIGFGSLLNNGGGSYNNAVGVSALGFNTSGGFNTAMGHSALANNATGNNNNAFGIQALYSSISGGENTAIGSYALYNASNTSAKNVVLGNYAGYNATNASSNIFIGYGAGYNELGSNKLYIENSSNTPLIYGDFATNRVGIATTSPAQALAVQGNLYVSGNVTCGGTCGSVSSLPANNVTAGLFGNGSGNFSFPLLLGINTSTNVSLPRELSVYGNALITGGLIDMVGTNAYIGTGAGGSTGANNVGVGYQTLKSGGGSSSVAIGYQALTNNSGNGNTAVGWTAMNAVVTGGSNSAVGYNSLGGVTSGANNVAVGYNAASTPTTGSANVVIGVGTMNSGAGTNINNSVAVGYQAMHSIVSNILYDTAVGYQALSTENSAGTNTGVGAFVMQTNSGIGNTVVGYDSMTLNSGSSNTVVGYASGGANNAGSNNIAIGVNTLANNLGGSNNTVIGFQSMFNNSTGTDNIAIGYKSLYNASGSGVTNNVVLGDFAGYNTQGASGDIFLGYGAGYNVTSSNLLIINNSSSSPPLIYGDFSTSRVGINTSTPTQALSVQGNLYVSGNVTCGGSCGGGGGVGGSGTTNYIPFWSAGTTLGNSIIYQSSTAILINGASSSVGYNLLVNGSIATESGGNFKTDSGQFFGGTDTAAAPAFSWAANANTGVYNISTNVIGITTNGVERMRVNNSSSLSVATTSAKYVVNIGGAGTMGLDEFTMRPTSPASPSLGDFWFDATQDEYASYTNGIKEMHPGVLFTQTADASVFNTNAATSILASGVGTTTLPANFFSPGKTVRITAKGRYHKPGASAGNVTIQIKLGSTVILDTGASTLTSNNSGQTYEVNGVITDRTTGASGSVAAEGGALLGSTATGNNYYSMNNAASPITIDTTAAQTIGITWQFGTASTTLSATSSIITIESLN